VFVPLVSKISNLCDPDSPTYQTDRRTDRRMDNMQSQYHALHHSASCGKKARKSFFTSMTNTTGQLCFSFPVPLTYRGSASVNGSMAVSTPPSKSRDIRVMMSWWRCSEWLLEERCDTSRLFQ